MNVAVRQDEMGQTDVIGAQGTITWLGHATVLMTTKSGTRVVFDPWFEGNPKNPVALDAIGEVHYIAVTHGHFDHMGSAVLLAKSTGATIVCVHEMSVYFALQGVANVIGMNKGGTVHLADVSLTMVGRRALLRGVGGRGRPRDLRRQRGGLRRAPARRARAARSTCRGTPTSSATWRSSATSTDPTPR